MKIDHSNNSIKIETSEEAIWLADQINNPKPLNNKLKEALKEYNALTQSPEELKELLIVHQKFKDQ